LSFERSDEWASRLLVLRRSALTFAAEVGAFFGRTTAVLCEGAARRDLRRTGEKGTKRASKRM